jgi:GNAT superfamily N-acetyltransferase
VRAPKYSDCVVSVFPVDVPELDRVVAVLEVVTPDDPTTVAELVDWRRQAEDMLWLVATDDGEDVGAGVGLTGWHSEPGTARGHGWVLPDARRRGVGSAIYAELTRWSVARGCTALETAVEEDDPTSLAWAERRGFGEVGRDSQLVLDLDSIDPPAIAPPEGIKIVTWSEQAGIEQALYEVYVEAEPDIPGEETNEIVPFERWLANDMQGVSDRPEAVFVALAGDEVVGYAKLAFAQESSRVFHDLTGVKRAWRGRGIAGALKRTQIAWAKDHGFERLVTRNEERNEPIRRLNVRYGYRVEPGSIVLRKSLGDAA